MVHINQNSSILILDINQTFNMNNFILLIISWKIVSMDAKREENVTVPSILKDTLDIEHSGIKPGTVGLDALMGLLP